MSLTHLRQNFWSVLNCATIFVNYGVNVNICTLIKKERWYLDENFTICKMKNDENEQTSSLQTSYMTFMLTKYVKFYLRRNSMKWIIYLLRRWLHMKKYIVHIYYLKNKLLATPVINRIMHVMILVSRDQTVTTCMFSIILLPISLLWFSIFWLHKFLFRRDIWIQCYFNT